jgi:hypothetical protein
MLTAAFYIEVGSRNATKYELIEEVNKNEIRWYFKLKEQEDG